MRDYKEQKGDGRKKKRFVVFTAVIMKNVSFWDVTLCRSCVCSRCILARDFSTLKIVAIRSSETLVHTRSTQQHIPEFGILQEKRRLRKGWEKYIKRLRRKSKKIQNRRQEKVLKRMRF
jgi:hypothetical protein